ncbi:MAG TPA: hypothetical protein P5254_08860 [Aquihabitans sp.]|nr:hypothetical protein [Aquihabitans sp.]
MGERRSWRRIGVGALVALVVGPGGAAALAAPAQDPPRPVVSASATDGRDVQAIDCLGHPDPEPPTPGSFTLSRTGPTTDALEVDVDYQPTGSGLPDPVVIPAGAASATVELPPSMAHLIVSLPAAAAYDVAPATASLEIATLVVVADLGCNLGYVPEVRQVVLWGQAPLPIEELAGAEDGSTLVVDGDLPPGTQLAADGTWTGVATELGTFEADVVACDAEGWCATEIRLVVQVTDGDAPAPIPPEGPEPPAARPVTGSPALTG